MVLSTRVGRDVFSLRKTVLCLLILGMFQPVCLVMAQASLPGVADTEDPSKNPLNKPGTTMLPGVRTSVTYSDNLNLNIKSEAVGGFRVEVAPYILAAVNTASVRGYAYYASRNFFRTAGVEANQFGAPRHDFLTNGRYQLIPAFLSLQGSAFMYDVNPINFGVTSADIGNIFLYPRRVQGYSIGPIAEGQLGAFATYSGGFSYGQTGLKGVDVNQSSRTINGAVKSGSSFNRWGWEWNGLNQVRDFASGGTFERNQSNGILYWVPNESLRVGGSIRYSQISGFSSNTGKNSGYGPGIAVNWNPSTLTQLKFNASAEYFGTTGELSITHSTPRFTFDGFYERGSLNSSNATLLNQNPTAFTRTGDGTSAASTQFQNYVTDSLYNRYGVLSGLGVVDSAFVRRDGGRLSMTYKLTPLSKVSLGYFDIKEATQIATSNPALGGASVAGTVLPSSGVFAGEVARKGISLTSEIAFDARSKLGISLNGYTNNFPSVGREQKVVSLSTIYSTRISPSATALVGLRHAELSGRGYQAVSYGENSVFGAVDMRF
jgi:uncharacterized protein (PEP-CTERM system associated)